MTESANVNLSERDCRRAGGDFAAQSASYGWDTLRLMQSTPPGRVSRLVRLYARIACRFARLALDEGRV